MKLKQKILISNIIMVCVPIMLAAILFGLFAAVNKGVYFDSINNSKGSSGSLISAQSALYLFESELSEMDWDSVQNFDYSQSDIIENAYTQKISEMYAMGYHINVTQNGKVIFSNMSNSDLLLLEEISDKNSYDKEQLIRIENNYIITDNFNYSGNITYHITAVYNEDNADVGVKASVLPIYFVSPTMIVILLLSVLVSIIVTNIILTQWLNHSILDPLNILKAGAKKIADGDLNYRCAYNSDDEFGEVYREFDTMRIKLKQSEEEKSHYEAHRRDLLIGISHDLRSPLTSIKGYTEGLKDGIANTESKRKRYYEAILTRTADLERLIGSLSVLVKLENDEYLFSAKKVNLNQFIETFLNTHISYLEQNNVTVSYNNTYRDIVVNIDTNEMQRVMTNLFENTIKHRESSDSIVSIEIEPANDENKVRISFSDNGPGVRENQLDRIFDSFYRADESRTRPENGSGLGLAVVKRIAEGHGGSVKAALNNGLVILITLPIYGTE